MSLIGKSRDLRSSSLVLRAMRIDDSEAMYEIYSDTEAMKYWACPPVPDLAAAEKIVHEDMEWVAQGKAIIWSVTLASSARVIGKCILFNYSGDNRRAEIGYILNRDCWRKGIMIEALTTVIDFAFTGLGLHRIEADSDTGNTASLRLLEKLGFQREGLFRERWHVYEEWQDSVMLGLLESDWAGR
jgi:RimJ/RimL family protein N-acetyltransferase